jgi:hypothetical protein
MFTRPKSSQGPIVRMLFVVWGIGSCQSKLLLVSTVLQWVILSLIMARLIWAAL